MDEQENDGITLPLIMAVAIVPVFAIIGALACGGVILFIGLDII